MSVYECLIIEWNQRTGSVDSACDSHEDRIQNCPGTRIIVVIKISCEMTLCGRGDVTMD